jgi:hypothetical protein
MRRRAALRAGLATACAIAGASLWAQAPPGGTPVRRADTGPITRPDVREGDQWIYRRTGDGAPRALRQTVTRLLALGISLLTEVSDSADTSVTVYDRGWGLVGSGFNDYRPALAYYSFPLYAGKRWGIDSEVSNFGAGQSGRMRGEGRALEWEEVDVPAGRFTALKVEVKIEGADPGDAARTLAVEETHWYVREVQRPVRVISRARVGAEASRAETIELVSYRLE